MPVSDYRGRLAPSPTGYLHVGHAKTFWVAWQRARDAGGALVMRMEDLDPDRSRSAYADAAYEDLRWLGIRWHEGRTAAVRMGLIFRASGAICITTRGGGCCAMGSCFRAIVRGETCGLRRARRTKAQSGAAQQGGKLDMMDDEPIYAGTCRENLEHAPQLPGPTGVDAERPEGANWRFRVPDGEVVEFNDINLGPQRFVAGEDFGDFVVWRRDGVPSYQLACVVDDNAMHITEVVGADLLKSTARRSC